MATRRAKISPLACAVTDLVSLGAVLAEGGVNFSVFSSVAEAIDLCIFDEKFAETRRIPLLKTAENTWHCFAPGVGAGTIYGYRVHGPWEPEQGHYCNPQKVLLDPQAKSIARNLIWHESLFPQSAADSAASAPLSMVVADDFDWGDDALPQIPFAKTVIYEAHVRGLTRNFPGMPDSIRGTYLALAHESVIEHLLHLGVTTLELLPVHAKCDDKFLVDKGLTNYWGYSTLNFFSPEPRYASGSDAVSEFKTMVKALHRAGIEVILDVVYNHTAEMGADGPLLSMRGFDNRTYYLFGEQGFIDHTGCGNTLHAEHSHTRHFILDSLRYWASEMHVDGFRFDLAPAIFREGPRPVVNGAFGRALLDDAKLSRLKLIAEPWDLGNEGYARDAFGEPWRVWNDRFRDGARRFWRGDGAAGELWREMTAERVINYVTCHDGFTLHDLVSYQEKHNVANREDNRDGSSENFSTNYGHEGKSDDTELKELRLRQRKNFLATLFFSAGTPMLLAGDEWGHSQQGNNNAYCQDNALTHLAWHTEDDTLRDFIRYSSDLRARFDWTSAVLQSVSAENHHSLGFCARFPDGQSLVVLLNASPTEKAVFSLPQKPECFHELINTAATLSDELRSGILVLLPRSVSILQGIH